MRPCFRVRLASRAITRFYDDLLVPSGLRVPHFVVLVGVFRGFGTMLTALGGVLGMDRTSLSKALRPLLRRGFVMRVPTTDRRRWTLQATRRGERLLARTIPYWQRAQQQVVRTVGSEKWASAANSAAWPRRLASARTIRQSASKHVHGRGAALERCRGSAGG